MYRGGFWATIEFFASLGSKGDVQYFEEDVEDWLNSVSYKMKMHLAEKQMGQNTSSKQDSFDEDDLDFRHFFKFSLTHPPVRSRLEMLMGSNVVRLTDRTYMLKLMEKIKENHEKQQRMRIEEKKKQELIRTKNMILHKLIPVQEAPDEIRQYPLFQLYLYCDELLEKRRKKRMSRKVKMSNSLYRLLYPNQKEEKTKKDDEDDEVYMKRVYIGNTEKLVPLSSEEVAQFMQEREAKKDIEDGYMLSQEDYDRLHYETDAVKNLREIQTVDELYAKAYEIVGVLHSHVQKELKKEQGKKVTDDNFEKSKANSKETADVT